MLPIRDSESGRRLHAKHSPGLAEKNPGHLYERPGALFQPSGSERGKMMVQKIADSVRARQSKRARNEGPVVTLDSSVQALLAGLVEQAREQGTVSVADLLGQLLSIEGMAERRVYLDGTESDGCPHLLSIPRHILTIDRGNSYCFPL